MEAAAMASGAGFTPSGTIQLGRGVWVLMRLVCRKADALRNCSCFGSF